MHRFYLPPDQCSPPSLFLAGREAHHALHVLRVRKGERVTVLDGAGHEFLSVIEQNDRDKIRLSVVEQKSVPRPQSRITLLQAIPKGKLFESIVQKATELGVERIVPILSERVVVHMDAKEAARKVAKWQLTAVEAIKQCGAPWLPRVEMPATPCNFLAHKEQFALPLVASLQPGSRHARQYFDAFHSRENKLPESICIWIGPEGDFTAGEIELLQANGALPITLGPLVLRVETAATYCLSILNYETQPGSAM